MEKIIAVFFIICLQSRAYAVETASCDFRDDTCGWTDEGGTALVWNRTLCDYMCTNYMMALPMYNATRPGDKGRLLSPMLSGTANQNCTFQFRFHLENPDNCRLLVLTRVANKKSVVWHSARKSGYFFEDSHGIEIVCSAHRFQLIFEGEKTGAEPCGAKAYDGILINDVVLSVIHIETPLKLDPVVATAVTAGIVAIVLALAITVLVVKRHRRMRGRVNTWVRSIFRRVHTISGDVHGISNRAYLDTTDTLDCPSLTQIRSQTAGVTAYTGGYPLSTEITVDCKATFTTFMPENDTLSREQRPQHEDNRQIDSNKGGNCGDAAADIVNQIPEENGI